MTFMFTVAGGRMPVPMLTLGAGAGAEAGSAQPSARIRSSRSITWADAGDERPVSHRTCNELQLASVSDSVSSCDGHRGSQLHVPG